MGKLLILSVPDHEEHIINKIMELIADEPEFIRTARVFELFFLDIPGFSGFLLLGYPVCEPQKLSRFFMNSQALLLSAFRIFPQFTFYLINRRQRTFKILRYQF